MDQATTALVQSVANLSSVYPDLCGQTTEGAMTQAQQTLLSIIQNAQTILANNG